MSPYNDSLCLAIPSFVWQLEGQLISFIEIGALYQNWFKSKWKWNFWENSIYFTILLHSKDGRDTQSKVTFKRFFYHAFFLELLTRKKHLALVIEKVVEILRKVGNEHVSSHDIAYEPLLKQSEIEEFLRGWGGLHLMLYNEFSSGKIQASMMNRDLNLGQGDRETDLQPSEK